jgi:type II secretory pathway pseudopilin PulG
LLVVIAIIGILVALLLPAIQAAREAARRTQCNNNLKQIALAVQKYHDTYRVFPPASGGVQSAAYPGCAGWVVSNGFSWRTMILPSIEQQALYDRMDSAFHLYSCYPAGAARPFPQMGDPDPAGPNSPGRVVIPAFICPSDPSPGQANEAGTNYAGVWGNTPMPGNPPAGFFGGVFSNAVRVNMASIVDGTANTAMVGEVFRGKLIQHAVTNGTYTNSRCRRWVEETGWCGCATNVTPNDVRPDLITWVDEVCGSCFNNTDRRPISSLHPGGALCAYADGSVHFIPESVDGVLWSAAGSRDGKEASAYVGQ